MTEPDIWWVTDITADRADLENWQSGQPAQITRDHRYRSEPTWLRVEEALPGQVVLVTGLQWLNQRLRVLDPASRVEILRIESDPEVAQQVRRFMYES